MFLVVYVRSINQGILITPMDWLSWWETGDGLPSVTSGLASLGSSSLWALGKFQAQALRSSGCSTVSSNCCCTLRECSLGRCLFFFTGIGKFWTAIWSIKLRMTSVVERWECSPFWESFLCRLREVSDSSLLHHQFLRKNITQKKNLQRNIFRTEYSTNRKKV